ncbi:hypothetical protein BGZ60DRAFT_498953 [Tricladium varicosporioides]|nr:hypothetical protein BGZ60DRAFT_498953 [Hymenoscyphus varicosporioides]
MAQIMPPQKSTRTGRTKVKSGCRTCKIRRIKCDEARPACRRCVTTGRTCDGYGIWGGGGSPKRDQLTQALHDTFGRIPKLPVSAPVVSSDEMAYLEWYKCRTSTKLPGIFVTAFWKSLVFQAISTEPAVIHAILALGSMHKKEMLEGPHQDGAGAIPDKNEQFMLQQYNKAIKQLESHFSTKNESSKNVALISCVIFINLELLRGRYRTAQIHLQNGLKLLKQAQEDDKAASREPIDSWVVEAFFRLQIQIQLLGQGSPGSYVSLHMFQYTLPKLRFQSLNEARNHIDVILDNIMELTGRASQCSTFNAKWPTFKLLEEHRLIQRNLETCFVIFKESKESLQAHVPGQNKFAYFLLNLYFTMAHIMVNTCLSSENEMSYDPYITNFLSMITDAIALRRMASLTKDTDDPDMSRSINDIGWIPPLYYTALKCRVHRIRVHAIKILRSTSHREGFWEARIMARIAEKVMEIEEASFDDSLSENDYFDIYEAPQEEDLCLLELLNSNRVYNIEVVMPDQPFGIITLKGWQKRKGVNIELFLEYSLLSKCWSDTQDG